MDLQHAMLIASQAAKHPRTDDAPALMQVIPAKTNPIGRIPTVPPARGGASVPYALT